MASTRSEATLLLVLCCIFVVCSGKTVDVGGSEQWRLGFDYNDWALKNGPFLINDILVFKYAPSHSVYLLPDRESFSNCDLTKAKKVADVTQGGGNGFSFVLKQAVPHFFACGEADGFHCKNGNMKFSVTPPKAVRGRF